MTSSLLLCDTIRKYVGSKISNWTVTLMIKLDPANCETVSVMHSGAPTKAKREQRKGERASGREVEGVEGRKRTRRRRRKRDRRTDSWIAIHSSRNT